MRREALRAEVVRTLLGVAGNVLAEDGRRCPLCWVAQERAELEDLFGFRPARGARLREPVRTAPVGRVGLDDEVEGVGTAADALEVVAEGGEEVVFECAKAATEGGGAGHWAVPARRKD